jgi:hypothetical protein
LLLHWWTRSGFSASLSTGEKLMVSREIRAGVDYRFRLEMENDVRSLEQVYMPIAIAPIVEATVSSRTYYDNREELNRNKFHKFMLEGKY